MANTQFPPFPILATARLDLRQLSPADAPALAVLRSDEQVNRYLSREGDVSLEDAAVFIEKINRGIAQGEWLYWAICWRGQPELLGTICLWQFSADRSTAEIGYELHPRHQGQGVMDEALKRVVAFGFEDLGLAALEAFTHRDNAASARLLLRNRFERAPQRRDAEDASQLVFKRRRD